MQIDQMNTNSMNCNITLFRNNKRYEVEKHRPFIEIKCPPIDT